jgi:glutaredoxin
MFEMHKRIGGDVMANKRKVEVFSAGCSVCNETVELVKRISCPSCDVTVLNMNDQKVAQRARSFAIRSVPAVVVDGKLASCCAGRGPKEADLRAAGIGQPL